MERVIHHVLFIIYLSSIGFGGMSSFFILITGRPMTEEQKRKKKERERERQNSTPVIA